MKTKLSLATLTLLASTAQAGVAPYTTDANTLILYNFESVTGSLIANAASASSTNDGVYVDGTSATATVLTNAVTATSFAGFGNSLNTTRLRGVGVDVNNDNAWNYDGATNQDDFNFAGLFTNTTTGVGEFTLEAMVNLPYIDTPAQTTFHQEIWCSDTSTGTRAFQFRIDDGGTLRFDAAALGTSAYDLTFNLASITGTHAFEANKWFHVAITYKYDGVNPAVTRFYWTRVDSGATQANLVAELVGQPMTGFTGANSANLVFGNEGRTNGGMAEGVTGLLDEGRVSNIARTASQFIFNTASGDNDNDGLLDAWEIQYFGNLNQTGSGDFDGDGASNEAEETAGSNPTSNASTPNDVDADGLADSWEISNFGSISVQNGSGDPDLDFATNEQEETGGSNPNSAASVPDTDGDGLNDGWEVVNFGSLAQTGSGDFDSDGANNTAEQAAGSDPKDATWTPTKSKLVHRWGFNGDLTDSVGATTATIVDPDANSAVGGSFTQSASAITLGGGASTTSAYVNLGSNLIGGKKTPVTIELWASQIAVQNWGRIFDFGSSTTEYLFMSWTQGTNAATDQVEWVDGVTSRLPNTNQPYALGTKYHVVLTLTPAVNTAGALTGGTRVTWYSAPADSTTTLVARGTFDTANHLANLNDLNNWLGRSMWAADNVANASYDEVRIWNGALSATEVNAYQLAGPNAFTLVDTDSDGLPDAWELLHFRTSAGESDATILAKYTGASDPDGDGFSNATEYGAGSIPVNVLSTPTDTDGDGLLDSWEISNFGNLAQTGSGDFDGDRATNLQEYLANPQTDPKLNTSWPDADSDGLNDGWEIFYFGAIATYDGNADPDDDSYSNFSEQSSGSDPTSYVSSFDSDGDGLPDGWEIHYFKLSGETGLNDYGSILPRADGTSDPDSDGFSNALEYSFQTNPNLASSVPGDLNNDGVNDGPVLKVGGDLINTTSFDNGLNWHDGATPVAGKTYIVFVNGLRTPVTGDFTFAGDKLVLTTSGTNTGTLIWKTPGAVTFPLIQFDGGILNQAAGTAAVALNGNVLVTRASNLWANNGAILVNAALSGTGDLNLTGGNAVTFAGSSTWKGNLNLANTAGFTLASTGNLVFAPGANGVTNAITGTTPATLNGTFNINTAAASTVSGSSWVLVATTGAKTYGATFAVAGYTADAAAVGSRKWTSGAYSFDEATGTLSVTAPPLSALETWRQANFGSSANTGSGADTGDFDFDGRVNLVEYALGTDPKVANTGAATTLTLSGGVLSLTFAHGADASIGYVIDASPDLVTWTQVQSYGSFTTAGSTTYVDSVTLGAGSRRFLRLRITY